MADNNTALVSGKIVGDVTWSGEIVLAGSVKVTNGATLTIKPGTNIIIQSGGDYLKKLIIDSDSFLVATSDEERITFSSEHGTEGSWGGIEFLKNTTSNENFGSLLKGVDIHDANNAVSVVGQGISIEDCLFEGNKVSVYLHNTDGVKIVDSVFNDSESGIYTDYESDGYGPILNTNISRNKFKGKGPAISIWPNQRNVDNLTIKDNAINNTYSQGIMIGGGGYGSHLGEIFIAGNNIDSNSGIAIDAYSWISDNSPGLVIRENDISGSGVGLAFGHSDRMLMDNVLVEVMTLRITQSQLSISNIIALAKGHISTLMAILLDQ